MLNATGSIVATLLIAFPVCAQTDPVIRSETRIVQVDVSVRDAQGKNAAGLTRENFTVMDAGRARPIQFFSAESGEHPQPGGVAVSFAQSAGKAGVYTNQLPPTTATGHTTVVVLDGINTTFDDFVSARQQLAEMVKRMRTGDRMAVYVLHGGIRILQDYTADRDRPLKSVESFPSPSVTARPVNGNRPSGLAAIPDAPRESEDLTVDMTPAERALFVRTRAEETMHSLQAIGRHMAVLPGRKSLIWVSGGFPATQLPDSRFTMERMSAQLNEANVGLYAVDAGALAYGRKSNIAAMVRLSESTGGKAFYRRNDLDRAMQEAADDTRQLYTLGFYLSDSDRDGRFHPLRVSVNRPGLKLSYRQGYFSGDAGDKAAHEQDVQEALLSPLDATGVGIAAIVEKQGDSLKIALRLDPATVALRKEDGQARLGEVEVLLVQTAADGAMLARVSQTMRFRVFDRNRQRYESGEMELPATIKLDPAALTLRIVLRDTVGGRLGSLTVPLGQKVGQ